jgi:hypothetical protein
MRGRELRRVHRGEQGRKPGPLGILTSGHTLPHSPALLFCKRDTGNGIGTIRMAGRRLVCA